MNGKMIIYMLGKIAQLEAVIMLPSLICSIIYRENQVILAFAVTILLCLGVGLLLSLIGKPRDKVIFAKEGFVIVALAWIIMSALGALPFVISGEIPEFVDAFFETVSGFTTTGASILTNIEALSKGLLFWRSFTHWVGGVGVLVLVMAILVSDSGRTMHILRAEMPGPTVGKLLPRVKSTAKILYLIYIFLSALQVAFLLFGGMSLYESLIHMFGTAGTGGFSVNADSIASYSPYLQWVITIFMIIFGVNFNLYYFILAKRFKAVLKSEEFWVYLSVAFVSSGVIAVNIFNNIREMATVSDSIRHAAFQTASIMTTTGYATTDFNLWPTLSKTILLLLMFIGACAGSTAGGLKVSRVIMLFKSIKANLKHALHSRSVETVKFEGKPLDREMVSGVNGYLCIYVFCFAAIVVILGFDIFDFETNFSAAAACFNNVGPGFGFVGPAASYADYSVISKLTLSAAMLLGRLEIYPIILLFSPHIWTKKKVK
ncbi:MAG: TrkH family potassium uptake protein [Clostridia bacterium]|nr:TrkH family potassium uptake protein [Clostridia bacterium]